MLKLSDENLATLRTAAEPLDPRDRTRFVECVAETVHGHDLGGGEFHRVCRALAAQFRRAPEFGA
jgi:DNA-binding MurR/RpiR family transcriptional regulator